MNSVNVVVGPPGSGKSALVRSKFVSRWYAVCYFSYKVLELLEEQLSDILKERHRHIFMVSFRRLKKDTYLLRLDYLEQEIMTFLNYAIRSALSKLLGDAYPVPENVLPPVSAKVVHEIMRMSARECLKNNIIEIDSIYAKVKLDNFESFMEEGRKCLEKTLLNILMTLKASALVSSLQYYPYGYELCLNYDIRGLPLEALCRCTWKSPRIDVGVNRAFGHLLFADIEIVNNKTVYLRKGSELISVKALSDTEKKFIWLALSLSTCRGCSIIMEKPSSGLHPLYKFLLGVALGSLTTFNYDFWIETESPEFLLGIAASCSPQVSRGELESAIMNSYAWMGFHLTDYQRDRIRSALLKGSCALNIYWVDKQTTLAKALNSMAPEGGFVSKIYTWLPSLEEELRSHG
ncbi:hypothetical protein IPA_05170 [Ignicoccus pacificus DSM 13166]|uniref:Uncharacterized protein n=1 Tax=Ignicoccus pacificus DSM 13166 TaxID=940294 RepID=A0A977PKY7_9CREN|nr:hypothetical protein IPA_05170 [Ignicoccus pacificus DSM 13166]